MVIHGRRLWAACCATPSNSDNSVLKPTLQQHPPPRPESRIFNIFLYYQPKYSLHKKIFIYIRNIWYLPYSCVVIDSASAKDIEVDIAAITIPTHSNHQHSPNIVHISVFFLFRLLARTCIAISSYHAHARYQTSFDQGHYRTIQIHILHYSYLHTH